MSDGHHGYEMDRALMEAEMMASIDAYFAARPGLKRTPGGATDRLFEAAFQRGWDAKSVRLKSNGVS